jgi:hypothetical protein
MKLSRRRTLLIAVGRSERLTAGFARAVAAGE